MPGKVNTKRRGKFFGLERAKADGHKLDSKTNNRVLCSVLGFQNLRKTNAKHQHIWVREGTFRLLAFLAV